MGVIERFKKLLELRRAGRLVLVLERGQSVLIDERCLVTFTRTQGSRLVLSVQAPREVKIQRASLIERDALDACDEAAVDLGAFDPRSGRPVRGSDIFDRIVSAVVGPPSDDIDR